jgi:signal transduction histidine kinase
MNCVAFPLPLLPLLLVFLPGIPVLGSARAEPKPPMPMATAYEVPLPWTGNLSCTEVTPEGLLLIGGRGLYSYDGHSLLEHFEDDFERVLGLHASRTGRIHFAAYHSFGYIRELPEGNLELVRLSDRLPEEHRQTKVFFNTHAVGNEIFYTSFYHVFRYGKNGHFTIWETEGSYPRLLPYGDKMLISDAAVGGGLFRIEGKELQRIPGSEVRNVGEGIIGGVPRRGGHLFMTGNGRLLVFDGERLRAREAVSPLPLGPEEILYKLVGIAGDKILALSTDESCFVLSAEGELEQRIHREDLPLMRLAGALSSDARGAAWMDATTALVRLNFDLPVRAFHRRHGIEGKVLRLVEWKDRLYFTISRSGMPRAFRLAAYPENRYRAEEVAGVSNILGRIGKWFVYTRSAAPRSVFYRRGLHGPERRLPITGSGGAWFYGSSIDERRAYLYTRKGLFKLHADAEGIRIAGSMELPGNLPDQIAEKGSGIAWISNGVGSVYRIDSSSPEMTSTIYGRADGLPAGWIRPFEVEGRVLFASPKGIHTFVAEEERFRPEPTFEVMPEHTPVEFTDIAVTPGGDIWALTHDGGGVFLQQPDGSYIWHVGFLGKLPGNRLSGIQLSSNGEALYAWGLEGILKIDLAAAKALVRDDDHEPAAYVRRIEDLATGEVLRESLHPRDLDLPVPYRQRNLRLLASSTNPWMNEHRAYQFRGGNGGGWSKWTMKPTKLLADLWEGEHRLQVRTGKHFADPGEAVALSLRIAPPFLRSWPAYLLYALAGAGIVIGISGLRSRQLKRNNARLEALVSERNEQLQRQNDRLQQLNREKDEFLGMASHDLRSPLGAIVGAAEVLQESADRLGEDDRELIKGIIDQGRTGLTCLGNLLDLNRIEEGKVVGDIRELDLLELTRNVVASLEQSAEKKSVSLQWTTASPVRVSADPALASQCIENLLSNALKYSFSSSVVEIAVYAEPDRGLVAVRDYGQGIKEEEKDRLFRRFAKLSARPTAGETSTGLGLAIVQRLMDAMGGTVSCESEWGRGSVFTLSWPLAGKS